jgi:nitroreductase
MQEQSVTDTMTLLTTRRSVAPHMMQGPGPDATAIETILTVASRVPDHGKLAPWRFVIFDGEARHAMGAIIGERFKAINPDAEPDRIAIEAGRLARAPLVITVVSRAAEHPKIPLWEQQLSAGAVCMNLVWAANALGFSTAWLTEWFAYDADIRAAMRLDADERIAGFIHIGRAIEPPVDRPRPALADLVTHWLP